VVNPRLTAGPVDLEFKLRRNAVTPKDLHTISRIICAIKVVKPGRY